MYQLKKIVVSVDLSDLDEEVIRYTSIIADIMKADTVYFLHVAKDLNLPEEILEKYPDLMAPADETIKHEVQDTVNKYFNQKEGAACSVEVIEGRPTDILLKYAKRKHVDLIILGRPSSKEKFPVNIGKIAELSTCSVLFVPKHADIKIDNLVVAMDFSKNAESALEQAMHIAQAGENVNVYGHHVYHVPSGYHYTGKSYEEFADIMLSHAKKDAQKFYKKYNISEAECIMTYSLTEDDKIHDEINKFAAQRKADMILIGSRGRTAAASMLLGSVAEKLLRYDNSIPLFIVKDKKENMGFLEALLKI